MVMPQTSDVQEEVSRCYNIFGVRYMFRITRDRRVLESLDKRFSTLQVPDCQGAGFLISVRRYHDKWKVSVNGRETVVVLSEPWPNLAYLLKLLITISRPDLLFIHASSVALSGEGLLFVGTSTSGKSTLAAELCKCGAQLISDDLSVVEPEHGCLLHLPVAPGGKEAPLQNSHIRWADTNAKIPLRHIFLLNADTNVKIEKGCPGVRPGRLSSQSLTDWSALRTLCLPDESVHIDCHAGDIILRDFSYFECQPKLKHVLPSKALMELRRHILGPARTPSALLRMLTSLLRNCRYYSLRSGYLPSTVSIISGALNDESSNQGVI